MTFKSAGPLPIYAIAASVGIAQLCLAYLAGVWQDVDDGGIVRFGYLRTFHWSLVYIAVMPLILSACIPAVSSIFERAIKIQKYRLRFVILVSFGLAFACGIVGTETWRSLMIYDPSRYPQWNDLIDPRARHSSLVPYSRSLHLALIWLAYFHYFLGCLVGFVAVIGTMWHFWLVRRELGKPIKIGKIEVGLLVSQQTAVIAYLFYLVLLRSSKASMHLQVGKRSVPFNEIWDFLKHADPYLEAISSGLLINLFQGVFWVAVMLVTHALAWEASNPKQPSNFISDVFVQLSGGFMLLGKPTRFLVGLCLVAIALPPPGLTYLVIVAAVLGGVWVLRSEKWSSS
jgi:hypothetical protein